MKREELQRAAGSHQTSTGVGSILKVPMENRLSNVATG